MATADLTEELEVTEVHVEEEYDDSDGDSDDENDVNHLVQEVLKKAQATLEYEIENHPTDVAENDCVCPFM